MLPSGWMWKKQSTVSYWHKLPFVQAVGMVNDHVVDCFRYAELRR